MTPKPLVSPLAWAAALAVLLTAACAPAPAPEPAPQNPQTAATLVPGAPTPTALSRATLPPEWTLTPETTPTHTPDPFAPVVVPPTPDMVETLFAQIAGNVPPECNTFGEDPVRSPLEVRVSTDTTFYWTPLAGAAFYEFRLLRTTDSAILFSQVTEETQATAPGILITYDVPYRWQVRPFDAQGRQLCPAAGNFLFVN
jgi:hypothetical protein